MENKSFLIDTHIFIWWMENSKNLSSEIKQLLQDPQQKVFLSVVSIWEMLIKQSKNQLRLPKDMEEGVIESGYTILPIAFPHAIGLKDLPLLHTDPFDRMLIAQAKVEGLTLITADKKIWQYDLSLLKM
ncbi:MAG: type II toxin-antitoxin system VapC family toxin [Patescibacteria group bacterium]